MKTYLQMDGDKLVEYVEKREYDKLALALHDAHNRLEQQLQDAVTRMEAVPVLELNKLHFDAMDYGNFNDIEAVRTRLIQAAKGEQP